jgi:hypothetical protein
LSELTRCHHQYQLAQSNQVPTIILALANLMADTDVTYTDGTDIRLASMIGELDINAECLAEIVETGEQQCAEIRSIILG